MTASSGSTPAASSTAPASGAGSAVSGGSGSAGYGPNTIGPFECWRRRRLPRLSIEVQVQAAVLVVDPCAADRPDVFLGADRKIPEFIVTKRRHFFLHNQNALFVKRLLLFEDRTVLSSVPYVLGEA